MLQRTDLVCVLFFTVELIIKSVAMGLLFGEGVLLLTTQHLLAIR